MNNFLWSCQHFPGTERAAERRRITGSELLPPGCTSAGTGYLRAPLGPDGSPAPPSVDTETDPSSTLSVSSSAHQRKLCCCMVTSVSHLDGKGLPVSDHTAQLDDRLHPRHGALDALVNQRLPDKHTHTHTHTQPWDTSKQPRPIIRSATRLTLN